MHSMFKPAKQPARMQKISQIYSFFIGVDQYGKVHVVKDSYNPKEFFHSAHIDKIKKFSKQYFIKDCVWPVGKTFLLTDKGLYRYDIVSKSDAPTSEFVCIKPALDDDPILGVSYSLNSVAVHTQKTVEIFGKLRLEADNIFRDMPVTDVKCGYESAYVLSDNKLYKIAHQNKNVVIQQACPEFSGKTIIDYCVDANQAAVWCDDGIYVMGNNYHGQIGMGKQLEVENFTKVAFFDNKKIEKIYMSCCHMLVRCEDGLYVTGDNNIGRLGLGDRVNRHQFTRLNVDHNAVTDILVINCATLLEINGQWNMAGSWGNATELEKHKLNFTPISFTPIESITVKPAKWIGYEVPASGPEIDEAESSVKTQHLIAANSR